jgi:hypothetical protein
MTMIDALRALVLSDTHISILDERARAEYRQCVEEG